MRKLRPRGLRSLEYRSILIQIRQFYSISSTKALGSPKLSQTQEDMSRSSHPCITNTGPHVCSVMQPLYPAQGLLFVHSPLHIKRGWSGSLPQSLHLHISDTAHIPLARVGPLPCGGGWGLLQHCPPPPSFPALHLMSGPPWGPLPRWDKPCRALCRHWGQSRGERRLELHIL